MLPGKPRLESKAAGELVLSRRWCCKSITLAAAICCCCCCCAAAAPSSSWRAWISSVWLTALLRSIAMVA